MKKIGFVILCTLISNTAIAKTFYEQARDAGFKSCLETAKTLVKSLVNEDVYAAHNLWDMDSVDESFFDSMIVKYYTDGDSHISLTIVPRGEKCDWAYTESYPVEKPCKVVREEQFSQLEYSASLNENSMALVSDEGVYFYLSPSETGKTCLVTKREVFYE